MPSASSPHVLRPSTSEQSTAMSRSKSSTSIDSLQILQNASLLSNNRKTSTSMAQTKNSDNQVSIVIKAESVEKKKEKKKKLATTNDMIYFYRSKVDVVRPAADTAATTTASDSSNLPEQSVLLEFIVKSLRKQLANTSVKTSFLNFYLICKVS